MRKTNNFYQRAIGLLLVAASFCAPACKKSEGITEVPQVETMTASVKKVTEVNSQADAAFNAYTNTFLITQGNTQYFKTSISDATKDYFWQQALDIQGVEDTYLRTKSAAHKTLLINLLNTFLQQNQGTGGLYDWNWNEYNDDILWAGIAFVRGYQITQNPVYLTQAKYAFNRAYDRGWDNALGGGIWWDIKHESKSGLSNNTAVILGCYIYESTKETAYLTKAQNIYNWIWGHIYDQATGAVWEKMNPDGTLAKDANVYNVGAFVSAANQLHRITGLTSIYDDAKRSVDYVRNNKTTGGVLSGSNRNGTWASEFARGLGEFVRDNNLWSTYYSWMKQNADAAWAKRRTDLNVTWNNWLASTPIDNATSANECISAVVMQQVTPAIQPGLTTNGVYKITPKMATGSALDINMTSNLADIWGWNGGANQKFKIVPLNYGYYRLIPQSATALSLDVTNNSNANDTPIGIYTTNNNSSQYFKLVYDYDGYYKLKPRCAPSSCVNVKGAGTANGTKCVLWQESLIDNERWLFQAQ